MGASVAGVGTVAATAAAAPRSRAGAAGDGSGTFASLLEGPVNSDAAGAEPTASIGRKDGLEPSSGFAPQSGLPPLRRASLLEDIEEPWPPLGLEDMLQLPVLSTAVAAPGAPLAATGAALAGGAAAAPIANGAVKLGPIPGCALPSGEDPAAMLFAEAVATAPPGAERPALQETPALQATPAQAAAAQAATASAAIAGAPPRQWVELLESVSRPDRDGVLAPAGATSAAAPLGLTRTSVVAPFDAPADISGEGFDEAVGTKLVWMAEQKIGQALIRINPQALGPVEIRMHLDGERVHAEFSSNQPEVRQALESSLPKLREMLASGGFELAQANVGQQHGENRQPGPASHSGEAATRANADPALAPQGDLAAVSRGLLDAYA